MNCDYPFRHWVRTGLAVFLVLSLLLIGHLAPLAAASSGTPSGEIMSLPGTPGQDYVADQILVKFKAGPVAAISSASFNQTAGVATVRFSPRGGFKVLRIPPGRTVAEMAALYAAQSFVEYAEPNYIARATWSPDDTYYTLQWNFAQINLEGAWALDTTAPNYGGDPSIIVAVIDSGVAYETYGAYTQAPDLSSTNFWTNSGEVASDSIDNDGNGYVDDIHGWDFINSDAHPNDDHMHGTHVTGTIAQSTNNSIGTAGRDDTFGWGLMHAANAVGASLPPFNSYKDSGHSTSADTFSDYAKEHTAYMYATGLLPSSSYRMSYYDGGNDKRTTEDASSDASGNFATQHTFGGADVAGSWHVVLTDQAHTPPATYTASWPYAVAMDTFDVQNSAIPESSPPTSLPQSSLVCVEWYTSG